MLIQPEKKAFLTPGYHACDIIDLIDESGTNQYATFTLKFILDFNGIERFCYLEGNHVFDEHGNIVAENNFLITRWTRFMDFLNIKPMVGFNEKGEFEDENGKIINDIAGYLRDVLTGNYIAYLAYTKPSKTSGKSFLKTQLIAANEKEAEAVNFVNFMLSKNNFFENDPSTPVTTKASGQPF